MRDTNPRTQPIDATGDTRSGVDGRPTDWAELPRSPAGTDGSPRPPELCARWVVSANGRPVWLWSERPPVDVDAAYDVCEDIARTRAGNFYYGIRLLPAYKRRALCAIYAFARRVDDAADGDLPPEQKLLSLAQARADIPRGAPRHDDPVLVALGDADRRFTLPLGCLDDLIDGAESDVREVRYETFADLVRYCRQVAGSIGRLLVAVLGSRDPAAAASLADDLGVAMQLTNILRDLVEDSERGRVYLPREDLAHFDCPPDPITAPPEAVSRLIRYEAGRNRAWYGRGLALLPLLDPRSAACVSVMAGIYQRILDHIERSPNEVLRGRISLSEEEKAQLAAAALATTLPSDQAA